MAKRTLVIAIDDLDGTDGAETVRFGLDGRTYEVDLSDKNQVEFRESSTATSRPVAAWMAPRRRADPPRAPASAVPTTTWTSIRFIAGAGTTATPSSTEAESAAR